MLFPGSKLLATAALALSAWVVAATAQADRRNLGAAHPFVRIAPAAPDRQPRELLLGVAGASLLVGSLVLGYRRLRFQEDQEGRPRLPGFEREGLDRDDDDA